MTRVVVAGAGIGGLATALALAQAGLAVAVYDRAQALREAGAGLQLSPNATRVLARLGVLDRVARHAVRPEAVRIRRGRDGADLARLPLGALAERRYGSPFLVLHRADLQAALLDAARHHAGITITTGQAVLGFETSQRGLVVHVGHGSGARVTAQGLVGADGLRSVLRAALFGSMEDDPIYCGRTAWRTLLPATPRFARAESNLWLGQGLHLVHYPVRSGTLVNVVAIVEDGWTGDPVADLWAVDGEPARLRAKFAGWTAEARDLVGLATDWRIWPLFDRAPLRRWSAGAVTLVGDAAHPMLPFLAQGASQAIEDAGALGEAVRRHANLTEGFTHYEQARRPTVDRAQREARRQGRIYHLGAPAALARDLALRLLGPDRMLARYDWLYGPRATAG